MAEPKDNLYHRAGIDNEAEFYRTKFVSDEVLDERYFKALDRFDIRFARTMWVYDNVASGSSVLDLGCGAGMLALLKRKGVTLTGVDISDECAIAARRNGYDATYRAELAHLPFPDASFDYVVSLDVIGHIDFEEKDAVLREIQRVLRPSGVTMHGIECTDHSARKTYAEMDPEELRRFVEIDGHVGLEEEEEHADRFRRVFKHVVWEPRYALNLSSEEFLKQADHYGLPFEDDFLDYLRGLSHSERRAFDMAMGYVFNKISDLNLRLPKSGLYVFVKASDAPLGPFYNEHRDRSGLFATTDNDSELVSDSETGPFCLDRSNKVTFDDGWYEPNLLPPIARWMNRVGRISFRTSKPAVLTLDIATHMPDLNEQPLGLELFLNGERLCAFSLYRYGWLELRVPIPGTVTETAAGKFELELRAERTWQPRPAQDETRDDRELSVAVCNITVASDK